MLTAAIDRQAEVPVGLQLGWALGARIRAGELSPGARLPGLRELARASGLNVNTVRAVYQRLEQQGLLESRQGRGTFVAAAPEGLFPAVGTIAADAARQAQATGVSPREVAAALYMATPSPAPGSREPADRPPSAVPDGASSERDGEAARRRALRAQIAALERAIGAIEAEHPGVAPAPDPSRRGAPGPTLLSAAELERVRSELVRRLAIVQDAVDQRSRASRASTAGAGASRTARKGKARAGAGAGAKARAKRPAPSSEPAPASPPATPLAPWTGRTRALPT